MQLVIELVSPGTKTRDRKLKPLLYDDNLEAGDASPGCFSSSPHKSLRRQTG
ncbi:hypothetical protein [Streptomyces sp. NPDC048644]|uniref:hypothetical protein n=1 Tax=Streptomyces sp. NPDC048644 TaxID=3365582 RepID=UPI00372339DD